MANESIVSKLKLIQDLMVQVQEESLQIAKESEISVVRRHFEYMCTRFRNEVDPVSADLQHTIQRTEYFEQKHIEAMNEKNSK